MKLWYYENYIFKTNLDTHMILVNITWIYSYSKNRTFKKKLKFDLEHVMFFIKTKTKTKPNVTSQYQLNSFVQLNS